MLSQAALIKLNGPIHCEIKVGRGTPGHVCLPSARSFMYLIVAVPASHPSTISQWQLLILWHRPSFSTMQIHTGQHVITTNINQHINAMQLERLHFNTCSLKVYSHSDANHSHASHAHASPI